MFGIKTKKDKEIERLREELKNITSLYLKPTVFEIHKDIVPVKCSCVLENEMPVEYAKESIATKFAETLRQNIQYDIEDVGDKKIIIGTLYVAMKV